MSKHSFMGNVAEYQEVFKQCREVRMPKDSCEILKAFEIFDIEGVFPFFDDETDDEKKNQLRDFGNKEIKILGEKYGKEQKIPTCTIPHFIDAKKLEKQWMAFKIKISGLVQKSAIETFRQMLRKTFKLSPKSWDEVSEFSEVFKLMAIIDSKPESAAENERVFSCEKRIMTEKRT